MALAFWAGLFVSLLLFTSHSPHAPYAALLPAALYLCSITRALGRQLLIRRILPKDRRKLIFPALIDILFGPLLGLYSLVCVLAAGCCRSIVWRGIEYQIVGFYHSRIFTKQTQN